MVVKKKSAGKAKPDAKKKSAPARKKSQPSQGGGADAETGDQVELLEIGEMARLLRISPWQLKRMAQARQVPGVKVEGRWLFNRDLVRQAMRRRSQGR